MAGSAIDGVWMGWYVVWLMDDGLMADVVGQLVGWLTSLVGAASVGGPE